MFATWLIGLRRLPAHREGRNIAHLGARTVVTSSPLAGDVPRGDLIDKTEAPTLPWRPADGLRVGLREPRITSEPKKIAARKRCPQGAAADQPPDDNRCDAVENPEDPRAIAIHRRVGLARGSAALPKPSDRPAARVGACVAFEEEMGEQAPARKQSAPTIETMVHFIRFRPATSRAAYTESA